MQLLGVPYYAEPPAFDLPHKAVLAAQQAKEEIEATGVAVVGIRFTHADAPLRFMIKFPDGPSFPFRRELEKRMFEIHQSMGDKSLTFYVTKRQHAGRDWPEQ